LYCICFSFVIVNLLSGLCLYRETQEILEKRHSPDNKLTITKEKQIQYKRLIAYVTRTPGVESGTPLATLICKVSEWKGIKSLYLLSLSIWERLLTLIALKYYDCWDKLQ
jgi:hypothetical protein